MTERRYSEEEVGAIFELATKAQAGGKRALPSGEGLTLSGLQEIGREIGIPPELVAQAARSLDASGRASSESMLGLPIGVTQSAELGRTLTDAEWERLVVDLRETFDATGRVQTDGNLRLWRNSRLQALIEPTESGHRIRLKTYNSTSAGLMTIGLALMGTTGAIMVSLAAAGRLGQQKALTGVVFLGVMSLLTFAWGALRLPGWARRRREQFAAIVGRLTTHAE